MGRLFGTDGIRGIANTELSAELATKIGRAAAAVLAKKSNGRPRILIGKDTRISGTMLVYAISAGFLSVGSEVYNIGTAPTPTIAYLAKKHNYDAAVVISASHNPCEYNGIKFFDCNGYKLPDEVENEIESIILDDTYIFPQIIGKDVGYVGRDDRATSEYVKHIIDSCCCTLDGMKIAFDCANGASSKTASRIFPVLGAQCHFLSDTPDGTNINLKCGSTHMDNLCNYVVDHKCDIGFAFDGDADRMLCVDKNGRIIDGDRIMGILAKHMKNKGQLNKNTLVATVMSNMGLFEFLKQNGISYEKTKVGDRYVLENMLENGYNLGGEQSGHIILSDYSTTGDGQLSAVQLMRCLCEANRPLHEIADEIEIFPQVMINVKVSAYGKHRLNDDQEIKFAISEAEHQLGVNGRILVRASGTEPLVRVMIEGRDEKQIQVLSEEIADLIQERLI